MEVLIKYKKLTDNAKVPTKATTESTGFDLYAAETVVLDPFGGRGIIRTGLQLDLTRIPLDKEVQIRPRSGLAAKHGVTVLNSPGTIDRDYRGEVQIILINHGDDEYTVNEGDKIAQMVIGSFLPHINFYPVDDMSVDTERGTGGFNSTGYN